MDACPDCAGSGVVHSIRVLAVGTDHDHRTWCRTCWGLGLVRVPDEDDEQDAVSLLWPESIRWTNSA